MQKRRIATIFLATLFMISMLTNVAFAAPAPNVTFLSENGAKTGTVVNGAWYPDRTLYDIQGYSSEIADELIKWEYVPGDNDNMKEERFSHPEKHRVSFKRVTNAPSTGYWKIVRLDKQGNVLQILAEFGRAGDEPDVCEIGWTPGPWGCQPIRPPVPPAPPRPR